MVKEDGMCGVTGVIISALAFGSQNSSGMLVAKMRMRTKSFDKMRNVRGYGSGLLRTLVSYYAHHSVSSP
jgi:hypothetical protein